jgi:hypothetical protein
MPTVQIATKQGSPHLGCSRNISSDWSVFDLVTVDTLSFKGNTRFTRNSLCQGRYYMRDNMPTSGSVQLPGACVREDFKYMHAQQPKLEHWSK